MKKFFKFYFFTIYIYLTIIFFISLNNTIICNRYNLNWPEETLKKLTLDEKIGQLFISATVINPYENNLEIKKILNNTDKTSVEKLITEYHIGGVIYLGNKTTTPIGQFLYTKKLQQLSNIPLFISQDLEWGLDMRLKNAIKYPYNIELGKIKDNKLIYELAKEIGRQCKFIGINFNFAPVCDVHTNPLNPVINKRSFGPDAKNVAQKAIAFMSGLQEAGIIACAKHFPGHGDTKLDSHLDLPLLEHDIDRLETIELYPFKQIINAGVMSVMVGHLQVPALENTKNTPATISYNIVTQLLKNKLNFSGLVITDALNMAGALKYHKSGEIELKSLLAGCDILLCPCDTPMTILAIKKAIENGTLEEKIIDQKVLKILRAKQWIKEREKNYLGESPENNLENNVINNALTNNLYNLKLEEDFMKKLNTPYAIDLASKLFSSIEKENLLS